MALKLYSIKHFRKIYQKPENPHHFLGEEMLGFLQFVQVLKKRKEKQNIMKKIKKKKQNL